MRVGVATHGKLGATMTMVGECRYSLEAEAGFRICFSALERASATHATVVMGKWVARMEVGTVGSPGSKILDENR